MHLNQEDYIFPLLKNAKLYYENLRKIFYRFALKHFYWRKLSDIAFVFLL